MIPLASLREQVYAHLRREIQQGKIEPGSTINIDSLSRELGISKTPLKEAIIKLESEGFINFLPRRGVQVRAITRQELQDYYEIIGCLEAGVVHAVFDKLRSSARIKQMKQSNAAQGRALKKREYDRYYLLNLEFHDIFLDLSENRTLRELVVPMKKRLYDFPRQKYWEDWEKVNIEEHIKFIACVDNGDRHGAAAVLRDEHWSWKKHEPFFIKFYRFV